MRRGFIIILVLASIYSCNILSESNPIKRIDIYNGQYRELMEAVKRENLEQIETLVKSNHINLNYADSVNGVSLLNWCIFNGKQKSFEKLLQLGADVNWQDTACAFAPAIVEGAKDVNTSDFLKTSLQYHGNANLLSKKMKGIEDQSPLFGAISSYRIESVKMLVEKNANVNQTQDSLWTPLAETLILNRIDIAKFLLENGADYNNLKFWTRKIALDSTGNQVLDEQGSPVEVSDVQLTILDLLRRVQFPLNTKEYKTKMEVVEFLESKGLDYWKHPIPDDVKKRHEGDLEYLSKY